MDFLLFLGYGQAYSIAVIFPTFHIFAHKSSSYLYHHCSVCEGIVNKIPQEAFLFSKLSRHNIEVYMTAETWLCATI